MAVIFPFFAFLVGWLSLSVQGSVRFGQILSKLLARLFIPFVIFFNMLYYKEGSLSLILLSFSSSIFLYYSLCFFLKDKLIALCASYVNIGWLGFPLALVLFGQSVSAEMIALYIGGSLFGNIWAVMAVSSTPQPKMMIIKRVLQSPPVIALVFAFIFKVLFAVTAKPIWMIDLYFFAKWGMVFAGMYVLGMWLRQTKISMADLKQSMFLMLPKLFVGGLVCGVVSYLGVLPHIEVIFFLFCLPPAANIVALEMHYQGTGVSARYIASGTLVSLVIIMLFGIVKTMWL